jgi:hypothetical protein
LLILLKHNKHPQTALLQSILFVSLLLLLQIVGAIFGSLLAAALVPEAHVSECSSSSSTTV